LGLKILVSVDLTKDWLVGEFNSILAWYYHFITLSALTSTFGGIVSRDLLGRPKVDGH
jgi:hypothetical protein